MSSEEVDHPRIESRKLEPPAVHRDEWRELAVGVRLVRLWRRRRLELRGVLAPAEPAFPDEVSGTAFACVDFVLFLRNVGCERC